MLSFKIALFTIRLNSIRLLILQKTSLITIVCWKDSTRKKKHADNRNKIHVTKFQWLCNQKLCKFYCNDFDHCKKNEYCRF